MHTKNKSGIAVVIEERARSLLQLEAHESVPWDERFDALGVDSLSAIEFVDEVAEHAGVVLPATALMEVFTLRDVAEFLEQQSLAAAPGVPMSEAR